MEERNKKAAMGKQNLPPLSKNSSETYTVSVTVSWSHVWSFSEKLGTITTWLIYRQIYQHLFLIGGCDGQLPFIVQALPRFFKIQNSSRHSKFVVCTSGFDQPRWSQQSEEVWCWKTVTLKELLQYITLMSTLMRSDIICKSLIYGSNRIVWKLFLIGPCANK